MTKAILQDSPKITAMKIAILAERHAKNEAFFDKNFRHFDYTKYPPEDLEVIISSLTYMCREIGMTKTSLGPTVEQMKKGVELLMTSPKEFAVGRGLDDAARRTEITKFVAEFFAIDAALIL